MEPLADVFECGHGIEERFARITVEKVRESGPKTRLDLFRVAEQGRTDGEIAHHETVAGRGGFTRRGGFAEPPWLLVFPVQYGCAWGDARWSFFFWRLPRLS